ncbi:hypothetical protein FA15DRAFT_228745 [Coprinopsis marcescibilis]|uniref:Uncharacterized protein n=1 Tax=Coprinopsis marcescibilis TaxID=230819 RepID=A0A5C3L3R2_COPMA|nr:hypothetical protein FA15DRAFT_228745 [Coprinopsis marcescibilis]
MVAVALERRQDPDVGTNPTASGVINSAVQGGTSLASAATELALDPSASPTRPNAGPAWSDSYTGTSTIAPVDTGTSAGSNGASQSISTGTVVGACIGALVGAIILILIGLFFYKRQSRELERRKAAAAVRPDNQSGKGSAREKAYKQLDEKDGFQDKWEGMDGKPVAPGAAPAVAPVVAAAAVATAAQTQQPPTNTSLEKMDMFKKPASAISVVTDEPGFEIKDHPYSQANLTKTPEPAELLGRETKDSTLSWAESTSSSLAIPTPAIVSKTHHWESAEVINAPEPQTAQVEVARMGSRNPFFGGKSDNVALPPRKGSQTSLPNRSRSNSTATVQQQHVQTQVPLVPKVNDSAAEKKDRVVSIDPFNDPLPAPTFIKHQPTGSASSAASNERAIKQLVEAAGMNLSQDEVQRRLKAISMQPSLISNSGDSMYTDADPDYDNETAMQHFPAPPSSSGHTAK